MESLTENRPLLYSLAGAGGFVVMLALGRFMAVFSATIGPGPMRLGSHWSRPSECLLRQQSYAIENQLVASITDFGCPIWLFMA